MLFLYHEDDDEKVCELRVGWEQISSQSSLTIFDFLIPTAGLYCFSFNLPKSLETDNAVSLSVFQSLNLSMSINFWQSEFAHSPGFYRHRSLVE